MSERPGHRVVTDPLLQAGSLDEALKRLRAAQVAEPVFRVMTSEFCPRGQIVVVYAHALELARTDDPPGLRIIVAEDDEAGAKVKHFAKIVGLELID